MRFSSLAIPAFLLGLTPLVWIGVSLLTGHLGANPIEAVIQKTGAWALYCLLLTLSTTPLRYLTGWSRLAELRGPIGLCAFFYATLHLLSYLGLEHFFDWREIGLDLIQRPFIGAGMASYALLLLLAVTSYPALRSYLGYYWGLLHKTTHLVAAGALIHYWLLVKADNRAWLFFTLILLILWLARWRLKSKSPSHL